MIENVRLVVADLSGKVYLARFGKNPDVALEKKLVSESDLLFVITEWMLHGYPDGAALEYQDGNGRPFELTLKPRVRDEHPKGENPQGSRAQPASPTSHSEGTPSPSDPVGAKE